MAKKRIKYFCMLMSDILMVYLSDLLAWGLLFGFTEISKHWTFWRVLVILPLAVIIFECSMYVGKIRRNMGTQIGSKDVFCTAISAVLAVGVPALLVKLATITPFVFSHPMREEQRPWNELTMFGVLLFVFTLLIRFACRGAVDWYARRRECRMPMARAQHSNWGNIMVIGGGESGRIVMDMLRHTGNVVKCVIDDDPGKKRLYLQGVPIVGSRKSIPEYVDKYQIDTIIFAIPSCNAESKYEIFDFCAKTDCRLLTVPSLEEIVSGVHRATALRSFRIEDLLERDSVSLELDESKNYLRGKTVLVTGGGGSIGSELCRQIAKRKPKKLIIFDVYENNAYEIQNELKHEYPALSIITLIGSVRDIQRLNNIFTEHHPQIVFHAAAHKHVPLMEDSPHESIKNNVFGTYNTAWVADMHKCERFILISTDKAVNPTNIMGASKRICEMIIQHFNKISKTKYSAVRFGNVLGSNGSVIPLFQRQIDHGGPVTVTHPDVIRYFMTISEAVSLVLAAGAEMRGGEIFVLDMGKPVKILTLAEHMIRLNGYIPYETMQITFIGLRPGEKLYEELLTDEEGLQKTANKKIFVGHLASFDDARFKQDLQRLKELAYDEDADIRQAVSRLVPTYRYTEHVAEEDTQKAICDAPVFSKNKSKAQKQKMPC